MNKFYINIFFYSALIVLYFIASIANYSGSYYKYFNNDLENATLFEPKLVVKRPSPNALKICR